MKTCFPITFLGFFDGTPFLLGKTYKRAGDEHISICILWGCIYYIYSWFFHTLHYLNVL